MCDNYYNSPYPPNSFYHHYLQQHAIMSYHIQKLHCNIGYRTDFSGYNYTPHKCGAVDYSSSSSCSCSSPASSNSETSISQYEQEYSDETYYEEEQCDDDESVEDEESESEYEFNVDAILAMRAAKEELKKESNGSESQNETESHSDSIVLIDSDKDDFEFVDLGNMKMLESKLSHGVGRFNKKEEKETQKAIMEYLYGDRHRTIAGIETAMALHYERLYDSHQPPLWPVLPLRL